MCSSGALENADPAAIDALEGLDASGQFQVPNIPARLILQLDDGTGGAGHVDDRHGTVAIGIKGDRFIRLPRALGPQLTGPFVAGVEEDAISRLKDPAVDVVQPLPGQLRGGSGIGVIALLRVDIVGDSLASRVWQKTEADDGGGQGDQVPPETGAAP